MTMDGYDDDDDDDRRDDDRRDDDQPRRRGRGRRGFALDEIVAETATRRFGRQRGQRIARAIGGWLSANETTRGLLARVSGGGVVSDLLWQTLAEAPIGDLIFEDGSSVADEAWEGFVLELQRSFEGLQQPEEEEVAQGGNRGGGGNAPQPKATPPAAPPAPKPEDHDLVKAAQAAFTVNAPEFVARVNQKAEAAHAGNARLDQLARRPRPKGIFDLLIDGMEFVFTAIWSAASKLAGWILGEK